MQKENSDISAASIFTLSLIAVGSFTAGYYTHKITQTHFLRRLKTAGHLSPEHLSSQPHLRVLVVHVGDSDNFRAIHLPSTRHFMTSIYWRTRLHFRPFQRRGDLSANTLHIRLAGIDAPESKAFGMPAQPFSTEAKQWLEHHVLGKVVHVKVHRRDQYQRLVCTVWRPYWFFGRRNVSLEMVQAGWAVVYESAGAEYNQMEMQLREAQAEAQRRRLGLWVHGDVNVVLPADHKRRHLRDDDQKKTKE